MKERVVTGRGRERAAIAAIVAFAVCARARADRVVIARPAVFAGDLRSLPTPPPWRPGDPVRALPRRSTDRRAARDGRIPALAPADPLRSPAEGARLDGGFGTPILDQPGAAFTGVDPAGAVGDVSPYHYLQAVNAIGGAALTVFARDGTVAAGPVAMEALGAGACATGFGEPTVLWDDPAERWLLAEPSGAGDHLCVYLSRTADPVAGGWFAYDFPTPEFPDAAKFAVWPGSYFVATNESSPAAYALERAAMLAGAAARLVRRTATPLPQFAFQALVPVDLDGYLLPPASAPGLFLRHDDQGGADPDPSQDYLDLFTFDIDWANPDGATLDGPTPISVADFSSDFCGYDQSFSCIAQPAPGPPLDPLPETVMFRAAYRNSPDHETIVGNFSVVADGASEAGIRWFELRRVGAGGWTLAQEGTYAPDATSRWCGSIAIDGSSDVAVAYSVASASVAPGLRYAGRLAGDPAGTLPQGEYPLVDGTKPNATNLFGEAADLVLDPADDCTFWFTSMWDDASASGWSTRIASFRFDACRSALVFRDGFEAGTAVRWNAHP